MKNILSWSVLVAIIGCLNPHPVFAIDPQRTLTQAVIRKWQTPQGLPQPRISAIYQSLDGHLWLGTQSGLFLFDGLHFFAPPPELERVLGTAWIQAIKEDSEQHMWIATIGSGLIRFADGEVKQYGLESGLPSLNIQTLLVDHRDALWIGTDAGVVRISEGKLNRFEPQPGLTVKNVRALCETSTGTICIGGDHAQLNLYKDGQFLTRPLSTISTQIAIRALLATPQGDVLIGTGSGLIRLDSAGESRIGRADGLGDDVIDALLYSSTGQVWVGTRDGLSRLGENEIETVRGRDGLSQSTVLALCEDHEKSLWVGTKNGLNQFVDRRTIPLTMAEGLPSNETGALLQDDAGTVFIGTLDAGLARYAGRRCDIIATRETGLPSNRISAMVSTAPGELWIGTDQGLCQFNGNSIHNRFSVAQGLPDNHVSCLLAENAGQKLWIGTGSGLAILQDQQISVFAPESELSQWPVRVIVNDAEGKIIATDGGGLFRCRNDRAYPWLAEFPEVRSVTAILQSPGQGYWAATRGEGLLLLHDNKMTRFTVQQGMYDDEIFGLTSDDRGQLWMACSRGIFFVNQQELLDVAAGVRERVNSTQFSPMEALRTIECQQGVQPSVWKMKNGMVWFSTIFGVIIIDPSAIYRTLPPFPVWIEQMQVNGKPVDPRDRLQLPAGQTNLMFRYSGLSFAFPTRLTFRYKLEGYDKDWVEAGTRREAYYTNVPPGTYQFVVSAMNPQNEWCTTTLPAQFVVQPYFYKTLWFYALVCVAACLLIWGILRFRVMQVRARMNAALAERMRIARDLHDTLIQGFSGVTMQMQALSARIKNSEDRETLLDVISDAGNCLREARRTVSGLRHSPGSATGLVDDISRTARQLTETHAVHLRLRMPTEVQPLPSEVEYNLLRIVQEAIANAVKHAGASILTVTLKSTPSLLTITVVDDGTGFQCQEGEQPAGHYGLIGMRERAHQIHAQLRIESRPGRGTTVEVSLAGKSTPLTSGHHGTVAYHSPSPEELTS